MRSLTDREMEVLECLASGYSLDDTAKELGIGSGTISHHRKSIYLKLRANSAPNAIYKAFKVGLFKVDS